MRRKGEPRVSAGHCLIADAEGNVWTGDEPGGEVVRIHDPT
jgi:hypothetical protein